MSLLLFKAEELKKLKDIEEEQGTTQEVTFWVSHLSCFIRALIFWAFKDDVNVPMFLHFRVHRQEPNMKLRQKTESSHGCLRRDLKKWKTSVVWHYYLHQWSRLSLTLEFHVINQTGLLSLLKWGLGGLFICT